MFTELRSVAAVDVVDVITVFSQEFRVASIECQTVAASLQFRYVIITFPVLVAGGVMWIETEIVGTFEVFLAEGCKWETIH